MNYDIQRIATMTDLEILASFSLGEREVQKIQDQLMNDPRAYKRWRKKVESEHSLKVMEMFNKVFLHKDPNTVATFDGDTITQAVGEETKKQIFTYGINGCTAIAAVLGFEDGTRRVVLNHYYVHCLDKQLESLAGMIQRCKEHGVVTDIKAVVFTNPDNFDPKVFMLDPYRYRYAIQLASGIVNLIGLKENIKYVSYPLNKMKRNKGIFGVELGGGKPPTFIIEDKERQFEEIVNEKIY